MKNKLLLFLVSVLFLTIGCNNAKKTEEAAQKQLTDYTAVKAKVPVNTETADTPSQDKLFDTITFDLNDDGKVDTISLIDNTSRQGDPGLFSKINISLAGVGNKIFKAKDVWDKVDSSFLIKNKNAISSENVFIYKAKDVTFLLLFGYIYGAGREEFSVIQIKNNKPEMIYDKAMDWPFGFADIEHNGSVVFVSAPTSSQISEQRADGDIESYDPYYIFSVNNGFKLDEELTKKYNLENYVWAGLQPSERIKVFHPKDGGNPKIVK